MSAEELREIDEDELEMHGEPNDAWMAVRGLVYDVTKFIKTHPGGAVITEGIGQESTELYDENHKWVNPKNYLKDCIIGKFKKTD